MHLQGQAGFMLIFTPQDVPQASSRASHEATNSDHFSCPICLELRPKAELFTPSGCNHRLCRSCAREVVLNAARYICLQPDAGCVALHGVTGAKTIHGQNEGSMSAHLKCCYSSCCSTCTVRNAVTAEQPACMFATPYYAVSLH